MILLICLICGDLRGHFGGPCVPVVPEIKNPRMSYVDLCVTRSTGLAEDVPRLGEPLLDTYLDFVAARCRPITVLAVAFDLKVFFGVVGRPRRRSRRGTYWAS